MKPGFYKLVDVPPDLIDLDQCARLAKALNSALVDAMHATFGPHEGATRQTMAAGIAMGLASALATNFPTDEARKAALEIAAKLSIQVEHWIEGLEKINGGTLPGLPGGRPLNWPVKHQRKKEESICLST